MKPYITPILASLLMTACAVQTDLPPPTSPEPELTQPSHVSESPVMDREVKKRSRLPAPKRIQYGEVVIDPYMAQRPRCDRTPGQPSAAHPTIKCNTRIHILDLETNREVWAVVTHRLSLEDGRVLYLAPRVGKELGIENIKGAQAKIEIVEKGMSYNAPRPSPKDFKRPMITR